MSIGWAEAPTSTSLTDRHCLVQTDEIGDNRAEPPDAVCPIDAGVVNVHRRRISRLISAIYASAVDPKQWESALVQLVRAFNAVGSGLLASALTSWQSNVMVRHFGSDPSARTTYNQYYGRLDCVAAAVEGSGRPSPHRNGADPPTCTPSSMPTGAAPTTAGTVPPVCPADWRYQQCVAGDCRGPGIRAVRFQRWIAFLPAPIWAMRISHSRGSARCRHCRRDRRTEFCESLRSHHDQRS